MDEYKNTRKTHHITFDDADMNQQNLSKMTNDRNIIQLLEMVKTQIENDSRIWQLSNGCLCDTIHHLWLFDYINMAESYLLNNYLQQRKPKQTYGRHFFFKPGLAKPRIEWLDEQIQRLQKEQQAL